MGLCNAPGVSLEASFYRTNSESFAVVVPTRSDPLVFQRSEQRKPWTGFVLIYHGRSIPRISKKGLIGYCVSPLVRQPQPRRRRRRRRHRGDKRRMALLLVDGGAGSWALLVDPFFDICTKRRKKLFRLQASPGQNSVQGSLPASCLAVRSSVEACEKPATRGGSGGGTLCTEPCALVSQWCAHLRTEGR